MMAAPFHIVILGGGTAGWMAANLFVKKWGAEKVSVTLIESPDIGIIGVGEGSTPSLKRFFQVIDVPDAEWMPKCNATYKMNIRFEGWSPASGITSYSHPFLSQLDTFTQRAFFTNCHARRLGLAVNTAPEDFLINGVLANQGKGPKSPDNFPFRTEYGYHFDSHLLGQFLAELAISRGVNSLKATIEQVIRSENGNITALITSSGEQIGGDFFVDCTGFAGVLMQKTLGTPFNSYKDNLFNDSAVVMPTPIEGEIPVETTSTAMSAGWCWKIPLTNRFGNGYVYSADFISADQAETELRQSLGMQDSAQECRHLKMRVGQLDKHWNFNCLALGLSQGFIEPLEATALHLVQICIELFIIKFEEGNFGDRCRDEYNNKVKNRFDRVRDYIVAHYKLNTRDDSDYWLANRNNQHLSESLLQILDVWYRRENLEAEIERQNLETHFGTASWHCLLAGYGVFPKLLENPPAYYDQYAEQNVAHFLAGCAKNYLSHRENLEFK
jgi:hypothetical protein